jgi:hypothetical protein
MSEPQDISSHLEPRSTHQGGGRGLDDDDNPTRAKAVVRLHLAGASWEEIAESLGYASARRVRDVYERALAETVDPTQDLPELRRLAHQRYERLLSAVWKRANDPKDRDHLAYSARALSLIEAETKLLGFGAPQQISVTRTPDFEEFMAWVQEATTRIKGAPIAVEAEILQIEGADQWRDETQD